MENVFFDRYQALCRRCGKSANAVAKELGIPSGSVTAWKKGTAPRSSSVSKIAEYFGVTADYLLGATDTASPTGRAITDEEIKFALFGGDGEITDAMYQEVRQFAQYVKFREGRKKE